MVDPTPMPVCLHTARLEQLGFNALLQLMIGVPLEMVHGLLRISLLYLAGVLAGEAGGAPGPPHCGPHPHGVPLLHTGSLTVSITDMRAPVVGGSGGVYALCSAHLANVVMVTGQPGWGGGGAPGALLTACLMLHQNWAGMRCPYKLLRMVLALVCSK